MNRKWQPAARGLCVSSPFCNAPGWNPEGPTGRESAHGFQVRRDPHTVAEEGRGHLCPTWRIQPLGSRLRAEHNPCLGITPESPIRLQGRRARADIALASNAGRYDPDILTS
jgi:hypothetical protein